MKGLCELRRQQSQQKITAENWYVYVCPVLVAPSFAQSAQTPFRRIPAIGEPRLQGGQAKGTGQYPEQSLVCSRHSLSSIAAVVLFVGVHCIL